MDLLLGLFVSPEVKEWLHAQGEVSRVATKVPANAHVEGLVINHLSHTT